MKRYKKSIIMPLALFIYATVMAIYFIPRNQELGNMEKWGTVTASYVIIALLWWVLRNKEQMMDKRNEEMNKDK